MGGSQPGLHWARTATRHVAAWDHVLSAARAGYYREPITRNGAVLVRIPRPAQRLFSRATARASSRKRVKLFIARVARIYHYATGRSSRDIQAPVDQ